MEPFAMHVFVCTGGGTCPHQGSVAVHAFLKEAVARVGEPGAHKLARDQNGRPTPAVRPLSRRAGRHRRLRGRVATACGLPDSAFRPRASWRLTPVAAFR
jgi:hypothetical protein